MLSNHQIESTILRANVVSTAGRDLANSFARIAKDFATQTDTAALNERIVTVASAVTGCTTVALMRFSANTSAGLRASTGDGHGETDCRIISDVDQGVALSAVTDRSTVFSADVASETRWPQYTSRILSLTPVCSILAVPILVDTLADAGQSRDSVADNQAVDVLVLYAEHANFFTDDIIAAAAVLADYAGIALMHTSVRERVANLRLALKNSREIGAAMGILMERHKVTDTAAFDLLKTRSQHLNVKLHTVAMSLATSGELPPLLPSSSVVTLAS